MGLNTDLAVESFRELSKTEEPEGVSTEEYYDSKARARVCLTEITESSAAERLGKQTGVYITVECDDPLTVYPGEDVRESRIQLLGHCISQICCDTNMTLVFGLGNRDITPDALGPLTAEGVFATRHIKRCAAELFGDGMSQVSAMAAGVMAKTGIESQEIALSLCRTISPTQVIVCDALACSEPSHMGRTIQLCSAGISPGSGVENSRAELSQKTLGVPTAAIGIPTVSRLMSDDTRFRDLMVTPREIDKLVKAGAELISTALNSFLQPELTPEEISSVMW